MTVVYHLIPRISARGRRIPPQASYITSWASYTTSGLRRHISPQASVYQLVGAMFHRRLRTSPRRRHLKPPYINFHISWATYTNLASVYHIVGVVYHRMPPYIIPWALKITTSLRMSRRGRHIATQTSVYHVVGVAYHFRPRYIIA